MLVHSLLCLFITSNLYSVHGQKIVSPNVIEEGGTFTVTCGASHAGVPTTASTVVSLAIGWAAGTTLPTTIARYRLFSTPYTTSFPPQTSPARNWTFNFSGSQQGKSSTPNNRNTMKIEMVVYDAKCTDAGLFYCNATYFSPVGDILSTYQSQNVTSITRAVPMSLVLVPQYEDGLGPYASVNPAGSDVTLICNVNGPKQLTFTWKYGLSSSEVNSFTPYPVQNDISVAEPVQISSGTTCVQYRHTSTLKFQTEDMYDGYMYVCVATENNEDTIVGNITIYIEQVHGQKIVSPNVIEEGGTFTVTCGASHAGVPTTASTVVSLAIGWAAGTTLPTTIARYRLFSTPYTTSFPPQTSPARNWTFNFSGSQQGKSSTPNNRNTMKIEMVVYDAKCTDAGLFYCNATYFSPVGDILSTYQSQNVTSITRAVPMSLVLVPQYEDGLGPYASVNPAGSDVTLICNVNGPKQLTFTWKYGPSSSDVNSFTSYPIQNDISVAEPVLVSSGKTCVQYGHTSTLKFQTEDMYDGYMYLCVATKNNEDTIVGNITIYIEPATPATFDSPSDSVGWGLDAAPGLVPGTLITVFKLTTLVFVSFSL
ncbi:uncharacterized protein LOC131944724 [Physella acuta]|uniref:uncharacterized protein LOC131944724 n=1 Tax=Physella acuta TaxID=109671 RepID=UPI0027DC58C6|nr:uncharacterized protein LOC131944724 [Physella acuta]